MDDDKSIYLIDFIALVLGTVIVTGVFIRFLGEEHALQACLKSGYSSFRTVGSSYECTQPKITP